MKGKDRAEVGWEERGGRERVKQYTKLMVRKDRSAFRKWGERVEKRRSEPQRET